MRIQTTILITHDNSAGALFVQVSRPPTHHERRQVNKPLAISLYLTSEATFQIKTGSGQHAAKATRISVKVGGTVHLDRSGPSYFSRYSMSSPSSGIEHFDCNPQAHDY